MNIIKLSILNIIKYLILYYLKILAAFEPNRSITIFSKDAHAN